MAREDIGSLVVRIEANLRNFESGMDNISRRVDGFGSSLKKLGGIVVTAFAVDKLADFGKQSIKLASDLTEVQNVVDTVFESASNNVNEFAKAAAAKFGLSELSAKKFTSTMGAMLDSMGLTRGEVLDMSKSLTGLAGDMASFYNLDAEEAFDKLRSGISGEVEPLKQLGINMSVANMEAFALTQGINKAWNEMNQAEQATLRYQYIMKTTAKAQGDFAKTSDSFANQQRILALQFDTLKAKIGGMLLPTLTKFTQWLNGNMPAIETVVTGAFEKIGEVISPLYETIVPKLQEVFKVFSSSALPAVSSIFQYIATNILPKVIDAYSNLVHTILPPLIEQFKRLGEKILPVVAKIVEVFTTRLMPVFMELLKTALTDILPPLVDLFGVLAEKVLPPLIDFFAEFVEKVLPPLIDLLAQLATSILPVLIDWLTIWADEVLPKLIVFWQFMIDNIFPLVIDNLTRMTNVVTTVVDAFRNFSTSVSETTETLKTNILNIWNSIIDFFTVTVPEKLNQLVQFFAELPGRIQVFLSDLFLNKIPYAVGYAMGFMIKTLQEGIPKFMQFFKDLPGNVWKWLQDLFNRFTSWGSDMTQKSQETGKNIVDGVINFVKNLPAKAQEWFNSTRNKITEFASNARQKSEEAGKAIVDGVVNFAKDLPNKIGNIFSQALDKASNFVNKIKSKLSEIGGNVVGSFKSGLGLAGARATGGPVLGGKSYLVGEKGPEIFTPSQNGKIISNDKTQGMLGQPTISYDGMFRGAIFNVRSDNDARLIAREVYNIQQARSRGSGVVGAT